MYVDDDINEEKYANETNEQDDTERCIILPTYIHQGKCRCRYSQRRIDLIIMIITRVNKIQLEARLNVLTGCVHSHDSLC